jgi:hypothetical protein
LFIILENPIETEIGNGMGRSSPLTPSAMHCQAAVAGAAQ